MDSFLQMNEGDILWISPDILDASFNGGCSYVGPSLDWHLPHSELLHAENLIDKAKETSLPPITRNYFLRDSVLSLNRCIKQRIKSLKEEFYLKSVPMKSTTDTDLFENLSIAKPLLITKINDIRNIAEHQYKTPEDITLCHELAEFTWYFLKTTDLLLHSTFSDLDLSNDISSFEVQYDPKSNWKISLRGELALTAISNTKRDDWISIRITKLSVIPKDSPPPEVLEALQRSEAFVRQERIYAAGEVINRRKAFVKLFFNVPR
jgi:hypothetical protein